MVDQNIPKTHQGEQSGWGEAGDRERSKQAGFDHHLVKPLDTDVLAKLLTSL